jgi:hypothetical protein
MRAQRSLVADAADGAIAGAVATWAMGKVTTLLYEKENRAAREREDAARHGKTAYGVAAEKLARLAGATLSDDQRTKYGEGIHWALGITAGALYGVLRERLPNRPLARGLAFGTAFWLLVDEGATPALGLTSGPGAFPWQTHARGAAGHLVFGAVTDATLDLLQATA